MNHMMVDIETVGSRPSAAMVSIGAVFFDPDAGEIGPGFYVAIDLLTSMKYGTADASTIVWWMRQGDAARAAFSEDNASLSATLDQLSYFIGTHCTDARRLLVWGNGSSFDNVILRHAYDATNKRQPWQYHNDRDVRTLVALGRDLLDIDPKKTIERDGIQHNALNDAVHQARYVIEIYQALAGRPESISRGTT